MGLTVADLGDLGLSVGNLGSRRIRWIILGGGTSLVDGSDRQLESSDIRGFALKDNVSYRSGVYRGGMYSRS